MTTARRTVRVASSFFEDLDAQLAQERVSRGAPSTQDFQVHELLRVVERFATGWDTLPELIAGRTDYRILVTAGRLVPRFAVVGQLVADGAVELVQLDIDVEAGW